MSRWSRRTTVLSVVLVIVAVIAGVGLAAAQADAEPESTTADPAAAPSSGGEPALRELVEGTEAGAAQENPAEPSDSSRRHHGAPGDRLGAAADYLGIDGETLRSRLEVESLASIAEAAPGKTVAGLREALLASLDERFAAAEHLTDEEKTQLRERFAERVDRLIEAEGLSEPGHRGFRGEHGRKGFGRHGGRRGHGFHRPGRGGGVKFIEAAGDYLGLEPDAIHEQLSEKTLAEIADETPGKSAEGLKAALTQVVEESISASDALSDEQKSMLAERIAGRIDAIVEGEARAGSRGHRRHGGKGLGPPPGAEESGPGGDADVTPKDSSSGAALLL